MPPATQPPYSRMRMSVAGGGPGPSRPQQNAGLAPPGAAQFAPRASMMPGGGAPQTVRKDASQMGRTPLKASGLRGAPGTGRPAFAPAPYGPGKETRPITHKSYQALMQQEVLDYLIAHHFPQDITLKNLKEPTTREFHQIFQFLMKDIDSLFVPGRWGKPEEEVLILLRELKYPLVNGISKTALATPGGTTSWPSLLAMLHWLVTLSMELPKWEDPRISNDYSFVPVEEIPRDVDLPNFATLVTSDYIFKAYELYMSGSDSFKGADDDLANIIDSRIEAVVKRGDETELRIAKLKAEIERLETNPTALVELDQEQKELERSIKKCKSFTAEREGKMKKISDLQEHLRTEIRKFEADVAKLDEEHKVITATIAEQGLSVEEVKQMNSDRDNLKRTLEDLLPKSAEAAQATGKLEIDLGRRSDVVDQMLARYTSMLYDTELLPSAPEPFAHVNFNLELNTAVSNPSDMLRGDDLKGAIHPALSRIAEVKSRERATLENEKIQADEDLDALTQQCHKMEEDAEPRENELSVLSKKIEELRMTVAGETAAANAESGKLEQELGSMEMESKQSDVVLTSRKQRLEVEFKDSVRKTEQLKQDTIQKIIAECDQMLNAKRDVAKELESLVLYARDN